MNKSDINIKRLSDDGSSCIVWKVFSPSASQADIEQVFEEPEGREIRSNRDCTGKAFAHPIKVRRSKTRTLVRQYWATDI